MIVSIAGIPITYSSNQVLNVLEETEDVVLTCSAETGEWQLPSGSVSQSFPVLTLSKVTSLDNNTVYTCKRIIDGDTLFEISVTLLVELGAIGSGVKELSVEDSQTPSTVQPSSQTTIISSIPITTGTIYSSSSSLLAATSLPSPVVSSSTVPTMSTQEPMVPSSSVFATVEPTSISSSQSLIPTSSTASTTVVSTTPAFHSSTPVSTSTVLESSTQPTSSQTTPTPEITTTTPVATTNAPTTPTATTEQVLNTTTEPDTTNQTTTTTPSVPASTPLSAGVVAIPVALSLIAALLLLLGVIALLFCCLLPCIRTKKDTKMQKLDNEYYTEKGDSSLESMGDKNVPTDLLPPYTSLEEHVFSVEIVQSEFKERVTDLWENEFDQLTEEYNSLGGIEMRYPAEVAVSDAIRGKNRYRNILPYDRSRVVLSSDPLVPGSDYINASHIPGSLVSQRFISSQGPKENTVNDFWQMLWENRVKHLVMLTRVVERGKKKCEQYWPDKVGDGVHMGPFYVTLVNLVRENLWVSREMVVRKGAKEKQLVKQFQFVGWPDFEAPRFPQDLILFMRKVKYEIGQDTSTLCVHCSAGVGRSGTFISLFNLMEAIANGSDISIFNVVNDMREYRPQMVQSWAQYRFIYLAVLELIHGDTSLHMNTFCNYFISRIQAESPLFALQFNELEFQSDKSFSMPIIRALYPSAINPDTMVLPFDDCRVVLEGPYWEGADYINASYVESFCGKQQFIATQLPISESVRDLLQLIFQTKSPMVVLLTSYEEFEEMVYDEGRIRYWPDPMTQHEFEGYTLLNESQFVHPLTNRMRLDNIAGGESHVFNLVTLLDWTVSGEFDISAESLQRLFQVTQDIEQSLEEEPKRPIVVQCRDGSGATGVFICAYNSICRIKCDQSVDVFQTAKRLRYCRQYMISSWVSFNDILITPLIT